MRRLRLVKIEIEEEVLEAMSHKLIGMITQIRHLIANNRISLNILFGVGFFLLSSPSVLSFAIGIPLILLGEGIRIWSSGYLEKNKVLQTYGPYSLTRNPLYLGNLFIGLGFSVIGKNLLGGVFLMSGILLTHIATILEEERYLICCFGNVFKVYSQSVPRLFPRWRWPEPGDFRWERVWLHREPNTLWGLIGGILILSLMVYLRGS